MPTDSSTSKIFKQTFLIDVYNIDTGRDIIIFIRASYLITK